MTSLASNARAWCRAWWPVSVVVLVGALAVGLAVADQQDDTVTARPGQVIESDKYDFDDVTTLTSDQITLPTGVVDIGVGRPVTDTSDKDFDYTDLADREAPDGGSFVAVSVEDAHVDYALPTIGRQPFGSEVPVSVALVADGRTYPVPAGIDEQYSSLGPAVERSAWVAVAGRPKVLGIAITFDGERQTVTFGSGTRVVGRAAGLYGRSDLGTRAQTSPCGTTPLIQRGFAAEDPVDCDVVAYPSLPYLPQFGWAPAGSRWQAVRVSPSGRAYFTSATDPDVYYYARRDPRVRVSLDGVLASPDSTRAPAMLLDSQSYDPSYLVVFRVPDDGAVRRLDITATWPKASARDKAGNGKPGSPDVTVRWTRSLR